MFGYVRPSFDRLNEAERARFRAVYCGLCTTLGKRYGFAARFILNYDFTLLAMLLSTGEDDRCKECRCAVHPLKPCTVLCENDALVLAADESVILAWWQIQDAIADSTLLRAIPYRTAAFFLRRAYKKARVLRSAFDAHTKAQLAMLSALEREKCPSLDRAADTFATLLRGTAMHLADETQRRVMGELFYHLGRWVYIVDAADDLARDVKSGSYNPLIYRYNIQGNTLDSDSRTMLCATLDHSVHCMAAAYELCGRTHYHAILDSVFYEGLYAVGSAVLAGTFRKAPRSRREHHRKNGKEETR
ncbi:MAG: hypothetical protein IJF15_03925 [Oscillospiraceae bacterium]|nr:hypothetical protein [Oscillospiraceae bacterium]